MKNETKNPVTLLREMIKEKHNEGQTRLPPERKLCAELGISRNTIRKAMVELEKEGLIWRRVGQGTFVGQPFANQSKKPGSLIEMTSPVEIMEVRLIIEPRIAAMAALRATKKEIQKMREAVHRSKTAKNFEKNEKWDLILHELIAQSANNHLLLTLFNTTNELRKGENWGRMKEASLTPERWKEYAKQHDELVTAIEDRNSGRAQTIMTYHLERVQRNLLNSGE